MQVVLDAGHYGKYNQSKVLPSYYESEMTWKLHLLLKAELEKLGVKVATTRAKQTVDLEVSARGKKAKGADLFISLHSDAASTDKPNWATVIPYQELDWTDIDDKSRDIATKLGACVMDVMDLPEYRLYPRKSGNDRDGNGKFDDEYYGVLYGARKVGTVGVLVEHGFHTNLKCAEWLSNDDNLAKLAKAEAKVIYNWLKNNATDEAEHAVSDFQPYKVKVLVKSLNIRKTPLWSYTDIVGIIKDKGIYTIVAEKMLGTTKFGKLKSGAGWISLGKKYVTKL